MNIQIIRLKQGTESTLSVVLVDGVQRCHVLEDQDRGLAVTMPKSQIATVKVKGRTAIPTGRYKVIVTLSPRFGKPLPLLVNVPGFEGIRIHPGNYISDTDGCLLPGTKPDQDASGFWRVWNSREAFASLFRDIQAAINRNELVWCEISRKY